MIHRNAGRAIFEAIHGYHQLLLPQSQLALRFEQRRHVGNFGECNRARAVHRLAKSFQHDAHSVLENVVVLNTDPDLVGPVRCAAKY